MAADRGSSADIHIALALELKARGEFVQSLENFQQALEMEPHAPAALVGYAEQLVWRGDLDHAVSLYKNAIRISITGCLPADLDLAVLHYVRGDWERCRELISDRPDRHGYDYWRYLALLLAWHDKHGHTLRREAVAGPLHVVGESHSLAPHGVSVPIDGAEHLCQAHWIIGGKQWHLREGQPNFYKKRLEDVLASLPPASKVMLAFGEIDARYDDGILRYSRKYEVSPKKGVRLTIDGYLDHVLKVVAAPGHHVFLQGVPCPTAIILQGLDTASQAELIDLICEFNMALGAGARARDLDFIDVHAMTNNGHGVSNELWHIDHCHLVPGAFAEAFKKYRV